MLGLPREIRKSQNPSLLNRTAAEELKRLFASEPTGHEKYREATLKAIERIEAGELTQIRVVKEIKKIAVSIDQKSNSSPENQPDSGPMLFVDQNGKQVGKINKNGKKITLILSSAALSTEQEKSLHEFVSELLKVET